MRQDYAAGTHQRTEIWLSTTFGCHLGYPSVHDAALCERDDGMAETEASYRR
jgi:hypothetical protein